MYNISFKSKTSWNFYTMASLVSLDEIQIEIAKGRKIESKDWFHIGTDSNLVFGNNNKSTAKSQCNGLCTHCQRIAKNIQQNLPAIYHDVIDLSWTTRRWGQPNSLVNLSQCLHNTMAESESQYKLNTTIPHTITPMYQQQTHY